MTGLGSSRKARAVRVGFGCTNDSKRVAAPGRYGLGQVRSVDTSTHQVLGNGGCLDACVHEDVDAFTTGVGGVCGLVASISEPSRQTSWQCQAETTI